MDPFKKKDKDESGYENYRTSHMTGSWSSNVHGRRKGNKSNSRKEPSNITPVAHKEAVRKQVIAIFCNVTNVRLLRLLIIAVATVVSSSTVLVRWLYTRTLGRPPPRFELFVGTVDLSFELVA